MNITFKKKNLSIILGCMLATVGCTTVSNSDKLGLTTDNESFVSYLDAYAYAQNALLTGQFSELNQKMNSQFSGMNKDDMKDKLINESSSLSLAERGLLSLNTGDFEHALIYFDAAEQKMGKVEDYTSEEKTGSFFKTLGSFATGSDEISDYEMRGYEKVMVLNYKALTYLLMGNRASYNATRNAIDRQIAEREVWEKEKIKIEAEQEKQKKESADKSFFSSGEDWTTLFTGKVSQYAKDSAEQVRSAFVNPFSDYLNAVVMEFDSLDDPSIADNAQKAYKEVLNSNPNCTVAKEAYKSIVPEKNSRLVHIIWADGFAPHKTIAAMEVPGVKLENNKSLVYKYSTFEPIDSKVDKARVTINKKNIALEQLSNVESLLFRDEQDSVSWRVTQMFSYVLRTSLVGDLAAMAQKPDTRSWLSLPKNVKVARLYVPNNTKEITIETLDNKGKVIATSKTPLADVGPTVVYAVSYNDQLVTYHNQKSWIEKN